MTDPNKQRASRTVDGFTLIETIVALSLSVLIVLGATQIFIEGLGHIRGVRAQALLTSDAGYMVQVIRNELFQAEGFSDVSADSVNIGGKIVTFSDDERLTLDGTPITRVGVRVTSLAFTQVGESLRIQFTLNSGPRTNKTFIGQTTLALRT
jgi:prepilin-type N-terminal cleavage/methylation domain-containing protein